VRSILFRDLRYAARSMKRAPAFSATVVLTLALGIAAATTVFSVVYGVLFRPLPYDDSERLALIGMERVVEGVQRPVRAFFPLADLADLHVGTRAFESIDFYSTEQSVLSHDGLTGVVDSASVSDSFFATAGGRLQSGRGFARSDENRACVISDRLRRRLFGTGNALGQSLSIRSRSFEIVGVAHQTFQLPSEKTDVWLPAVESRCCPYAAIARLKPGVSQSHAAADVNAIVPALISKSPRVYSGAHATVVGLRDELLGDVRAALWVLLASVGFVLAVSCANVTSLLLARNAARSHETAIRIALGASRARLCVQSLAEAGVAVTAGGTLGMLVASGLVEALRSFEPAGLPRLDAVRIDFPVFIFTLSVVAVTTAVVGLLPAVRSGNVADTIKVGAPGISAGPNRRRLQNGLVIVQLAVSVMLLVGAGLFGRSLVKLMTTDIGVRTDRVATAAINLSYGRRLTDAQQTTLVDAIVERVRSLPDVQAAGAGTSLPPNANNIRLTLKRAGDTVDYQANAIPATPGYFSALGVQLLKGRLFSEADGETQTQAMIMTADTARRFFDVEDPIGRTMSLPVVRNGITGTAEVTLVGVIGNVKYSGLEAAPDDAVYRPLRQQPWPALFLVARTSGDPSVLASVLRREITTIDRAIVVSSVNTLDAIVSDEVAQPRFRSALLAALATLSLVMASVGLYGVVAHSVLQRTNELGVRMALGANRADVLALVFLDGAKLAGAGLVAGVTGSLLATRILAGLLYGIEPTDAFSFGVASGLLLLVAAAATYVPARRASRLNPIVALRAE
jgi:putative ABC transport system permease protein